MRQLNSLESSSLISITVENKLIVYAKIEYKCKVEVSFLGNYNMHSEPLKFALCKVVEVLRGRGAKPSKVMDLGLDGTNVLEFVLS